MALGAGGRWARRGCWAGGRPGVTALPRFTRGSPAFGSGGEAAPVASSAAAGVLCGRAFRCCSYATRSRSIRLRDGRRRAANASHLCPLSRRRGRLRRPMQRTRRRRRVGGPFPPRRLRARVSRSPRGSMPACCRAGHALDMSWRHLCSPWRTRNAPGRAGRGRSNQPAAGHALSSSPACSRRAPGGAGPLAGLIDPSRIAVAGQSDGGRGRRSRPPTAGASATRGSAPP